MKFWKEHRRLRLVLILILLAAGLVLIITGQGKTGQLSGLFTMLAGLVVLLGALYLYNKPFTDPKQKQETRHKPNI